MMNVLNYLSVSMIPLLIFLIVINGVLNKRAVFEDFTEGAKNGFQIIVEIAPTIVGLIVAVGVLRTSGALDLLSEILSPAARVLCIPQELLPVSIVKMFSASGANGLLFDLFKEHGTDSVIGFTASVLLSCTETLFYTVSVYFMSVGIGKSRWTVPAGIGIAVFSLFISVWIAVRIVDG
ncbi:MAG: spore maturation protein [Lachnospiraceae bacterium]|nr:spore maturation protein [Lachnospiraceae bacterium]